MPMDQATPGSLRQRRADAREPRPGDDPAPLWCARCSASCSCVADRGRLSPSSTDRPHDRRAGGRAPWPSSGRSIRWKASGNGGRS